MPERAPQRADAAPGLGAAPGDKVTGRVAACQRRAVDDWRVHERAVPALQEAEMQRQRLQLGSAEVAVHADRARHRVQHAEIGGEVTEEAPAGDLVHYRPQQVLLELFAAYFADPRLARICECVSAIQVIYSSVGGETVTSSGGRHIH